MSPFIYVEPGITIANCLYGGIKIGPTIDFWCGLNLKVDDEHDSPTALELYGISGGGLELKAVYGIDITVPVFNFRISNKGNVQLPNPLRMEKQKYPIWTLNL